MLYIQIIARVWMSFTWVNNPTEYSTGILSIYGKPTTVHHGVTSLHGFIHKMEKYWHTSRFMVSWHYANNDHTRKVHRKFECLWMRGHMNQYIYIENNLWIHNPLLWYLHSCVFYNGFIFIAYFYWVLHCQESNCLTGVGGWGSLLLIRYQWITKCCLNEMIFRFFFSLCPPPPRPDFAHYATGQSPPVTSPNGLNTHKFIIIATTPPPY